MALMYEIALQAEKMLPWHWTGSKIVLFSLVTLVAVTGLTTTGRDPRHKWLMAAGYVGLLILFIYGIATRGALGSIGKAQHGPGFFVFFFPHVLAGLFYLVVGAGQLGNMTRLLFLVTRQPSPRALRWHRACGRWLVRASLVLGLFGLAL